MPLTALNNEEVTLLRKELELLMSERHRLLQVAGAAAVLVANLDTESLPQEQDTIDAAEVLAESLNSLPDETLKVPSTRCRPSPTPRVRHMPKPRPRRDPRWTDAGSTVGRCREGFPDDGGTQLRHDLRIELPGLAGLLLGHLLHGLSQMHHDVIAHRGRIVLEQEEGYLPLNAQGLAPGRQPEYRFDTHGDAQTHGHGGGFTPAQYSAALRPSRQAYAGVGRQPATHAQGRWGCHLAAGC